MEVACRLAAEAGREIAARLGSPDVVDHKSAVDLVTETDRAVEELVTVGLRDAFPSHAIVAEESGGRRPQSGPCWYVDPIDGTANFVHGLPHCAVSIALLVDGRPQIGVVHDPSKDEMFRAERNRGATLNERGLQVSTTPSLETALVATGFPYDRRERSAFYLAYFEPFLRRCQDLRRLGSASLDLCWVAAGRFDGFWEWGLKPWDTAAGWLIVLEAGGRVSDFDGSDYDPWQPRILASNGHIHEEAVALLASVQPERA